MIFLDRAQEHFSKSVAVQQEFAASGLESVLLAAQAIAEAFGENHKLLLCGNGGSAAECQHLAAEFVGRLSSSYARPGLPALALTTDTSFLTAHANDVAFEDVFRRQVQALGQPGDVLLGISTSGNSANIIRAIEYAKAHSLKTVGFVGRGGKLASLVDLCIRVPSDSTQHVQETQVVIVHILCDLVEQLMKAKASE